MRSTVQDTLIFLQLREEDEMKISILIDIILVAVIWITSVKGYKKGLVKTVYSLVAFIAAAIITALFYKDIVEYLMSLTFIRDIVAKLNQNITDSIIASTGSSLAMPVWMGDTITYSVQAAGISAAGKLVEIIIMIATVVITFLLVKLILGLLVGILDTIMKLPILDTINRTGGLLGGLIKGVLIVLISFGIISMFVAADKYQYIHNAINETYVAKYFYNNNILMRLIMK